MHSDPQADEDRLSAIVVDIIVQAGAWPEEAHLRALAERSIAAARQVASADGTPECPAGSEVSLVFADDAAMRELNRQWRDRDRPTNVLSFPQSPVMGGLIGDVVLGFETVQREAGLEGKRLDDHIAHLVVHGFLHLLGYDHVNEEDAEHMERLEREGLHRIGIADPYAADAKTSAMADD
jgi:probable rRNA maturation factor